MIDNKFTRTNSKQTIKSSIFKQINIQELQQKQKYGNIKIMWLLACILFRYIKGWNYAATSHIS